MMPPANSSSTCNISGSDLRAIVESAAAVDPTCPEVRAWWECCFPGTNPGDMRVVIACPCSPDHDVEHALPASELARLLSFAKPADQTFYRQFYGLAA